MTWNGLELDHHPNPVYLGVTLDRTLSFKQYALNTKAKVNTRNNLLRKLTNSRWGAHPATLRTTALALCFSTAEFACSSWGRSRHTGHVDIALNDTCRIITGCLKATPIPCLCALAGIAPPHIRRKVASNADRCLQEDDPIHPLHGQRPAKHRLPSRNSFLDSTEALTTSKQDRGIIPNIGVRANIHLGGQTEFCPNGFSGGGGSSRNFIFREPCSVGGVVAEIFRDPYSVG